MMGESKLDDENMINELETKLERIDAEMKSTHLTYEMLNSDYLALQEKLE